MANESTNTLTLTAVVVQDQGKQGYTGYMLEIPEVIAEGNTEQEVEKALFQNLRTVMEFKREDFESEMKESGNFSKKTFELELA